MYSVKISISKLIDKKTECTDTSDDICSCEACLLEALIDNLRRNGQVIGREYPFFETKDAVSAFITIADKDSLDKKYHHSYTHKLLDQIGIDRVQFEILGEDCTSSDCCECSSHEQRQYLIMHTNYIALSSPIDCGQCQKFVPLYKLPFVLNTDEHIDILRWEKAYQSYDYLNMNGFNEKFALAQLGNLESEVNVSGREICQDISKFTGIPCYYYLHIYYGESIEAEKQRKCPSCEGNWLLDEQFHYFDFKCDNCQLLSNIALDFDEE